MIWVLLLFLVGLTALTLGADWLVTGASRLAAQRGVSPLLVGLTVVAFGTSAPELVVSSTAAFQRQVGLAIGNIMGSTVANVGLIVGIGALIRPIEVHRKLLFREAPLMVIVLAAVMLLAYNTDLGRVDGIALTTGFLLYLAYVIRWGISEAESADLTIVSEEARALAGLRARRPLLNWLRVALGLGLLLAGASWLVRAATDIATHFNVSEEVIGATMVAVGTSLPELASTIAAAARGLGDIALGNVIGSNIFNLGLVLGVAAIIRPMSLGHTTIVNEIVPALVFCIVLIPLAYTGHKISRIEGVLLLLAYAVFLVLLV